MRPPRRRHAGLDVDVEQDLGVIADEANRDDHETRGRRPCALAMRSPRSGPIHGSGVRPALWYAIANFSMPAAAATPRAVADTSSA